MLTTLLVVRRCYGGELPSRRVELYREAVRVLIRTWNTEGFEPMDLEETLAQLSYVACAMMNEGAQQVGHQRLLKLLENARSELQAELHFTRITAENFVERIEYRSSLLMQIGHERMDNTELQPVYEFRHLSFQEYLAARGLVAEQYPGRDGGRSLVQLLEPHFEDEQWREVIALASVLAGRKAEPLIKRLTDLCAERKRETFYPRPAHVGDPPIVLLRQCLLDEVQVTPQTLHAALQQMARHGSEHLVRGSVVNLRRGKFGEVFREVTEQAYLANDSGWEGYLWAMRDFAAEAALRNGPGQLRTDSFQTLESSLKSGGRVEKCRAALEVLHLADLNRHLASEDRVPLDEPYSALRDAVGQLLLPEDPRLALAAAWTLGMMGQARLPNAPPEPHVVRSLFRLWIGSGSSVLQDCAGWALQNQPVLSRDAFAPETWGDCDTWLQDEAASEFGWVQAKLVVGWYRGRPWSDSELADKLSSFGVDSDPFFNPNAREMLATLGDAGRRVLEQWDAENLIR